MSRIRSIKLAHSTPHVTLQRRKKDFKKDISYYGGRQS